MPLHISSIAERLTASLVPAVLLLFFAVSPEATAADGVRSLLSKPLAWFGSVEARDIAANVLAHQTDFGDWPKNVDTTAPASQPKAKGTFDNSATIPELKFLARIISATGDPKFKAPFLKGLNHILAAQYPNGGWPQTFPVSKGYDRHITFNDETMVNIMNFVRDVATQPLYEFVDPATRTRAKESFDRGIDCILKCQIPVNGRLAVWCAQHDEVDLSPRPARAYELISLSGSESAGLVKLLMSIERPGKDVIRAVDAAVAWLESVKITGLKQIQVEDSKAPKGLDKRIVEDPNAPPLWARFYNIQTIKPMFVDRDGIPKEKLSDIGYERRNGYAWYVTSPTAVIAAYPDWKKKVSP